MSTVPMNEGSIETQIENGIATITFSHPSSNSLPGSLLNKLAESIDAAGKNQSAKVIVLRSGGERAFCAGASFDELVSITDLEAGRNFFSGFAQVINAIRKAPKFVIGRVQGKTVGGGVGLASAVDYCLASIAASVKLSELAVGIGPFVVGPAVERKIGRAAMSQLAIDATNWQTAAWAREKGLYAETFETITALDEAVELLAQKLATSNPDAMAALKKTFWEGTEDWDQLLIDRANISGELVMSKFTRDAIGAFKAGAR
jgi:methylglutaconyl-CoA hydratase